MKKQMQTEPRIGVGAAIIQNDQILLIKRIKAPEAGCWALPGGKIDLYENAQDAVIRETFEETNLVISNGFLLTNMEMWDKAQNYHWIAPIYLYTEYSGNPILKEPNKHSGLEWFSINNPPPNCAISVQTAIAALLLK
jgi:ADP-ribose pyrophosphatase YjhB (NUDIX family)